MALLHTRTLLLTTTRECLSPTPEQGGQYYSVSKGTQIHVIQIHKSSYFTKGASVSAVCHMCVVCVTVASYNLRPLAVSPLFMGRLHVKQWSENATKLPSVCGEDTTQRVTQRRGSTILLRLYAVCRMMPYLMWLVLFETVHTSNIYSAAFAAVGVYFFLGIR